MPEIASGVVEAAKTAGLIIGMLVVVVTACVGGIVAACGSDNAKFNKVLRQLLPKWLPRQPSQHDQEE